MKHMHATVRDWPALSVAVAAALWVLFVNGAVPFLGMPTMGQAASMLGYAQSFADNHWYSIHVRSFGYPSATALATGLPLACVAGWFIRSGLPGPDAYAAAAALWLLVAFYGARRLAVMLGASAALGSIAAALWMTLPIVWAHQSFSSLAMGMALLPFYMSSALSLFDLSMSPRRAVLACAEFVVVCIVALFMDGYTFMMLTVGAALMSACRLFDGAPARRGWSIVALPAFLVGFPGAYLLYTTYVGRSAFALAPLEVFRDWALDLSFLIKPSLGDLWLWDWLGWSSRRTGKIFYGDVSVWTTTFALPLAVTGLACFISVRRDDRRAWAFIAVAIVGLYMALGPSIKFEATRLPGAVGPMPANEGWMPTGNAFISEHLPGFRSMRATYRWEALFLLGMWMLVILRAAKARPEAAKAWQVLYLVLILSSTPHLFRMWIDYRGYRLGIASIDKEVAEPLAGRLAAGERIFFVPFGNDVMANYLSPRLGVKSYNIGGDKQLEVAREGWPARLRKFDMGKFDETDLVNVRMALLEGDVDAVVVPYFDGLWSAHLWPCVQEAKDYSQRALTLMRENEGFLCPSQIRHARATNVQALRNDEWLSVDDLPLFAVVTLNPAYRGKEGHVLAVRKLFSAVHYPFDVVHDPAADLILGEGWYAREPDNRWSQAHADITIPLPAYCEHLACRAAFRLRSFAATSTRPVTVTFGSRGAVVPAPPAISIYDGAPHTVDVPLPKGRPAVEIAIDVGGAASPAALGMSVDSRVLGVSLLGIDILTAPGESPGSR